jgi:hypothetical protein
MSCAVVGRPRSRSVNPTLVRSAGLRGLLCACFVRVVRLRPCCAALALSRSMTRALLPTRLSCMSNAHVSQGMMVILQLLLAFCACVLADNSAGNASAVYGQQGSFTTNSESQLLNPTCARVDWVGNLYVCDSENSRIVRFAAGQFDNATDVWGWPNITTPPPGFPFPSPSATTLNEPADLGLADGGLYVVDEVR